MSIKYEKGDDRAYITLNRPEAHNALTEEMVTDIAEALNKADEDDDVLSIIVTGAGDDAFCAGGDLGSMIPAITSGEFPLGRGIAEDPEKDMMLKHTLIRTPIIAAVNGVALAGGTEFLQATDIRIAEEHATFGLPEVSWGLAPAGGSHTRLPRQIPYCRAMEILLTGDRITVEEASKMGLINEVVEKGKGLEAAEEYADSIAENGPLAVRKIKEAVIRGLSVPMEQAFYSEEAIVSDALDSEDAKEGPRAFMEKRDPEFQGK
ncbi:enoyl-CoA hydratase-related protein [Natrinema gelatinilyticum]|uniref:enoyl-CoA hydratase-related protein n=1 Tax=Natrinema gelatinilyticum TaxID=2961571 RepID=UPI0020C2E6C9|nr:enoyl-CoA hydratase-related protein [Natrinema gelatinilyticum]